MDSKQMWAAFEAKDARFDGRFFVAVRTTGIYCRPSCSARPARKNVEFFPSADAAEAAGYRACKRCHPRAQVLPAAELTQRVVAFIEANGHAKLDTLGRELNFSPFHLQRVFKQAMGVSPLQYAKAHRITQLKRHLHTAPSATTAIHDAGFGSSSGAYEAIGTAGMTPGAYRAGGAGATIGYTIVNSALGRMLVAGTQRGLCAVYFGDDDVALERSLREEYPKAQIEHHIDSALSAWALSVSGFLDRKHGHAALRALPLDVQGTAFQARVWQALRDIPEGETRSYGEVAQAIGRPTAMRAVANACGANRLAVVIPCHRVVREDGATGGYRWGGARKAQLLEREAG
jgi:AraC family transcriptional regulator, regulatory protein of adaptative response / methylated-DNA-[protein]-cysteine methyltransferase